MSGSNQNLSITITGDASDAMGALQQLGRSVGDSADSMAAAGQRAGEGGGHGLLAGFNSISPAILGGVAGIAASAGALLIEGIGQAMEQGKLTDKLQAQLGTTDKVAAQAGKVAGNLYANGVSDTFEDATEAIKATMQAGILPPGASEAQLQNIATKAQDVSKVFDQDLGGVTNAVSQMMRTGLAQNADEAFDVITKGMQNGANKADDLLDTFNEYGTQFRKLGLDGTTSMGLISQAVKNGARDSDLAADALKEFSIRAIDGSASTAQGFKMLGLDAGKMSEQIAKGGKGASDGLQLTLDKLRGIKDPVKQSQAAVALFGTQAEDLGKALYSMDPSKAVSTLGQVGGSAKKMGDTLRDNASTRIDVFKRKLQEGFVQVLGTYVIPVISRAATAIGTYLGPAIRTLTGFLGTLFSKAQSGKGVMAPVAAGFKTAADAMSKALGGAVNFVQTQFMPWFKDEIPKIKPVIAQVASTIGTYMEYIGTVISTVVKVASAIWARFGGTISSLASSSFKTTLGIIQGVFKAIQGVFQVFSGILTGNWSRVWTGLKNIVIGLKGVLVSAASGVFHSVVTAATGIVKNMPGIGKDIVMGLVHGITSLGSYVASQVSGFVTNHIPNTIKKVLGINSPSRVTKELGKWTGHGLIDGMTSTASKVHSTAKKLAASISKAMRGSDRRTKSRLTGLSHIISKDNRKLENLAKQRDKIASKLKNAEKKLADIKKAKSEYAANIKSGILGSADITSTDDGSIVSTGSILDKLKSSADKAKLFAKNLAAMKAKGVSKTLIDEVAQKGVDGGSDAAAALASGTPEQIKAINHQQHRLADAATKAGSVASKAMYDNGVNAAKGLVKGLQGQKKSIEKTMMSIAKSMTKAIKKALGIRSPSRVMAKIGDWTADGFVLQIQERTKDVAKATAGWAHVVSRESTWKAAAKKVTKHVQDYRTATDNANATGSDAAYVQHRQWQAAQPIVHVHVAGHVTTEKALASSVAGHVRDEIVRISKRNGGRSGL